MTANTSQDLATELPSFDLIWAYDDEERPTEVTIYSDEQDEITTHWITIEEDYAWDLENVP